jgi:cytochrome c oxidase subunit 2
MYLGWIFATIATVVCLIIALLLAMAIFRRRPLLKNAIDGHDKHSLYDAPGSDDVGMRWILIGTGISICALLGMAVYALVTLNNAANPPSPAALTITVTGYDWWWKIEYDNGDPARRIVTANEIHIPVGLPILLKLNSADVIHAFWVPLLAGKTQLIPGLTNQQWLQADVAGVYRGQCTQYCGVQHAHMAVEVVAQPMADFHAWQSAQRMPAKLSSDPVAVAGQKLFSERCAACHTVRGIEASGAHAPDLTHLLSRRQIAAGLLTNTPEHLLDWVIHAQQLKPGSRMPNITLAPVEAVQLLAFLATLH